MRIDLPLCGLTSCRYCFDCNCTQKVKYDCCDYQAYCALGPVEELTALVKAREEGRVVVLPCRVGDRAFVLETEDCDGGEDCIFEGAIVAINIGIGGTTVFIGHMERKCWFSETERRSEDLHTDWYLDEAEAEEALGGGGNE